MSIPKLDEIAISADRRKANRELNALVGTNILVLDKGRDLRRYSARAFEEGKLLLEAADYGTRYYEGVQLAFRKNSETKIVRISRELTLPRMFEEPVRIYRV